LLLLARSRNARRGTGFYQIAIKREREELRQKCGDSIRDDWGSRLRDSLDELADVRAPDVGDRPVAPLG